MSASALTNDYTKSQVFIYDMEGNHLVNTIVISHDKVDKQIQVANMPSSLKVNDECRLFILTSPTPCEYVGKVRKFAGITSFAMFQGVVKENRAATRYKVNTPAVLNAYVHEGKVYPVLKPINVTLINISTSGVRFRAPYYTLNEGDFFRINMVVSGSNKSLIAETINHLDHNQCEYSDYGCHFEVT